MVKKGKGKRGKGKNNEEKESKEWKKAELQKLWNYTLLQAEGLETHINTTCESVCQRINKIYSDKLKSFPKEIHNMTLSEYMQMQNTPEDDNSEKKILAIDVQTVQKMFERNKLVSEKKKTHKKSRLERKRSLSASICNTYKVAAPTNPLAKFRNSKVLSESCLSTPLSKRSNVPVGLVTPKFNPRAPLSKIHLRKPRAGEILMSLSGSPLQNFVDDIPDKPGVSVSLGGGNIIKITEDSEIDSLQSDLIKKLDDETKLTLENVKKKLDKILKA